MKQVFLASSSPRRLQLLQALGFEVQVIVPDVDETQLAEELPADMVVRLAKNKANAARIKEQKQSKEKQINPIDLPIIAADTIVCLKDIVLGKPQDQDDAIRILHLLSGKMHRVVTGYAVKKGEQEKIGFVTTEVTFRELTEEQILTYVQTGEPLDKAGAYGIQGLGACLIDHINGSYTNVIGLPVNEVLKALGNLNI